MIAMNGSDAVVLLSTTLHPCEVNLPISVHKTKLMTACARHQIWKCWLFSWKLIHPFIDHKKDTEWQFTCHALHPRVKILSLAPRQHTIYTSYKGATHGVTVSMSAFLACHQFYCADSSFAWGLNLRAVVCGIIWSFSPGVFPRYSDFLPSFIGVMVQPIK